MERLGLEAGPVTVPIEGRTGPDFLERLGLEAGPVTVPIEGPPGPEPPPGGGGGGPPGPEPPPGGLPPKGPLFLGFFFGILFTSAFCTASASFFARCLAIP